MTGIDWHRIRVLVFAGIFALLPLSAILISAVAPIGRSIAEAENDTISIHQFQKLALEKPLYRAEISRAEGDLSGAGVLYANSSPELASAQLQNTLQGLVAQAGGQIQSSAIGPPQTAHGLEVLSVSASLSLPANELASFLTSIETQKPYLVIDGLDVRSSDYGNQTGPLSIQLQVNGFSAVQ
jgi:hypothetical protein